VAVKIKGNGYFEVTYTDFQGGLNVQEPETEMADNCTPSAINFQTRNKELRSRPQFTLRFNGMDPNNAPLGLFSFLDVNAVTHTVAWSNRGLWQLAPTGLPPGALSPWFQLGPPNMVPGNPVAYRAFANVLYYCNGGSFLASWDGISLQPTASNAAIPGSTSIAAISVADAPTVIPGPPPAVGPLSIGGLFLSELDNHLILANITVLDNGTGTVYLFPNQLWYSANGIPTQWDPVANTNAGNNAFLDVPDAITGLGTTGVSGYIFRTNGITFFDPTGNGAAPFQFDHLWASDHGIGNVFPWSIAFYGPIGMFISVENIYKLGVADFEPIGGNARDAIMADLALTSGNPTAQIVPTENAGYVYLTYRVSIPLNNFTRIYLYDVEKKYWNPPWDEPFLLQTGRCEEVSTGVLAQLPLGAQPPGTNTAGGSPPSGGGGGGDGGRGGGGGRPLL